MFLYFCTHISVAFRGWQVDLRRPAMVFGVFLIVRLFFLGVAVSWSECISF